jgi:uncharacterized membrane protein YqjE
MDSNPPAGEGLFRIVPRLLRTLREAAANRLELFLVECQEERLRLMEALLLAATVLVCATLALVLLTFALVVIFWDTHRVLVLMLLTGAYAVGAVAAGVTLRARLRRWQPFGATLEEIRKDRECLEQTN